MGVSFELENEVPPSLRFLVPALVGGFVSGVKVAEEARKV